MEELVDDNDIDIETLQAQIDLSLATTKTLVSSWVTPGRAHASSSNATAVDHEREIQELLRRPSRLGVGAPVPASTGILGHEAVKLKGKLAGKKRAREAEEQSRSAVAAEQSEDEEESRTGAIKKKPRVDPFNKPGPSAKRKQEKHGLSSSSGVQPLAASLTQTPPRSRTPEPSTQNGDITSPGKALASPVSPAVAGTPKKKKKKKHRKPEQEQETTATPLRHPADHGLRSPSPVGTSGRSEPRGTPTRPSQWSSISPAKVTASRALLNLDGPPPDVESSPTKKKRKRNKKKRKKKEAEQTSGSGRQVEDDAPSEDEEDS